MTTCYHLLLKRVQRNASFNKSDRAEMGSADASLKQYLDNTNMFSTDGMTTMEKVEPA